MALDCMRGWWCRRDVPSHMVREATEARRAALAFRVWLRVILSVDFERLSTSVGLVIRARKIKITQQTINNEHRVSGSIVKLQRRKTMRKNSIYIYI